MQVLSGMGGVGKTSLARAYSQRHLDDYGIVWWVRSEDPAAVDAEYRALLEILLPPGEATKVADARTVAFALLAEQEHPWLLVLDNVADTTVVLPPTSNGHVLITSRATGWPDPTPVLPLDTKAATDLLTSRSGDDDQESAKAMAIELGGLPLALAQAAGFVRTSALDLATYLRLYRERSAELLNEGRPADYPHTVATTWQLAMDRLTKPARELLNLLAFYAPDAIPVHRLRPLADELTRHRAIGELHAYSLITLADSNTVNVHRLVQAVTRNHAWADKARELIMAAMPERVTTISLRTWNALHAHVYALLNHLPPEHPRTLSVRSNLAYWTGRAGNAATAHALLAEVLPIRERVLGAKHPDTLATRHELARWTGHAGNAATAHALLAEVLPIRERVLGAKHPDTLITRHELAFWIGETGDAAAARVLFAELLPIRERVLGAKHPDTLVTRINLARCTGYAGDAATARDLLAELLPIQERVLGAEHHHTLITRNELALWTGHSGNAATARDLLAELLPIQERVAGAEHPDTLTMRENLAFWTGQAGDEARARDLFANLLPIREQVMGIEHPKALHIRRELAYWAELAGAVEEAGPGGGGEG